MTHYGPRLGETWSDPKPAKGTQAPGSPGKVSTVFAVWPQLLLLSNGALVLASGRPGIGFWVSPKADGTSWVGYDVEAEHSQLLPSDPWDGAHGTGTTSYTGIAEVEPGVVLLACAFVSMLSMVGSLVVPMTSLRLIFFGITVLPHVLTINFCR
jgi:hypothetical protein